MNPSPGFRKFMIVLASIICVVYLAYRAFFTFNTSTPYATIASYVLYVGELFGILNLLLYFLQVWEVREPDPMPVLEGRTVDVFVPTYNEDTQLLRATLEACIRMDYPHRTFVLDDGRRPEVEALARELGVHYITRPDNRNAKAGNLNYAFEQTDGEFIVVLDADHVPEPHFITRLIGYFGDEKLGYVQTPHAFYNFDSFQARLNPKARKYWEEGHLFYCVIQPGRNYWGCPIFAGSAAMFRRSALRDIGYIAVETITEDMHTGLRMNAKGWKSLAITERLVAGQAAPDITTFHSQRLRWGEGNLSIMAYDNPLTMRGLTLPQRLCYLGSMIHWAGGIFKLAIYLTPIMMLFTGVPPVDELTWHLAIVTLTYLFISLSALKIVSNGYGSIINSELFMMINFWTQIKSTWRALFKRKNQRFVVTKKRGRQTKQTWPFIRPQTYLIILSVLALFWGWGRLVLEISDDWIRPIIPTFWVLFHIYLAYMVARRAFWPVNRRFSIRHEVNLPVEYEATNSQVATIRYGITADLNETGMAFVAYEKLEMGSQIRVTIRGANEIVKCRGEIRSVTQLSPERGFPGFRHGVEFVNLTPPQMDALNRITLHYAVPRLYEQYNRGNRDTWLRRLINWKDRGGSQRRRDPRYNYHLPLILNTGPTEETAQYTSTEDLSRVSTAVIVDHELPRGTEVGYVMPTPLGEVRGTATVVRTERKHYAGQVYQRCTLEFKEFEGQSRNTLQSLANPDQKGLISTVLKPEVKPPTVRMGGPILIALAIIIPLLFATRMFVFKFVHEDDMYLRAVIDKRKKEQEITEEEERNVEKIFATTMQESYPSTDRLVLLMDALSSMSKTKELDDVTQKLAPRAERDIGLQKALAAALDKNSLYAEAEAKYQGLLSKIESGRYNPSQKERKELYLAAARSSVHAEKWDQAIQRFKKVMEDSETEDRQVRYEYAGALVSAKKYDDALKLFQNAKNLEVEDRKLMVIINLLKDPVDYPAARREAGLLADIAPDDKSAQLLMADVEMAAKNYEKSNQIIQKLINDRTGTIDKDVKLKLAQSFLLSKQYDRAFLHFGDLFGQDNNQSSEVVRGIIDSASSYLKDFSDEQKQLLRDVNRIAGPEIKEPDYLARLAWCLQRCVTEKERQQENVTTNPDLRAAEDLLKRAVAVKSNDPELQKQFAGLLIQLKQYDRAFDFIRDSNSKEAKELRIALFMDQKDYVKASEAARALLDEDITSVRNHELYVDTLYLAKKYDNAILHLEDTLKNRKWEQPAADRLEIKLAQIYLYGAEERKRLKNDAEYYNLAARRFQRIIDRDFEGRRTLWREFIDSGSSSSRLEDEQIQLAVKIAEVRAKTKVSKALKPEDLNRELYDLSRLSWILLDHNEFKKAQPLLDQAMELNPTDAKVREELAGSMAKAERFRDGLKLYAGLPLDTGTSNRYMALLHAGDKNYADAEKYIVRAIEMEPENRIYKRDHADIVSWKGAFAVAIKMFDELIKSDPQNKEQYLRRRRAECTLWNRQYEEALERFQVLYNGDSEDYLIWIGFAKSAAKSADLTTENSRTAEKIVSRLMVEKKVKDPVVFAAAAFMMFRIGEYEKAESLAQRAMTEKIDDPAIRRELATLFADMRRFKDALAFFDGVPLKREDRFKICEIAIEIRDGNLVLEQAEEILKENPVDVRGLIVKGAGLDLIGKQEEALAIFSNLLTKQETYWETYREIANAVLSVGDYTEAIQRFQLLMERELEKVEVWLKYIDSAASYKKRIPNPYNADQSRLAYKIYEGLVNSPLKDSARFSRLAWIMFRLGDRPKSVIMIDKAKALRPTDNNIRVEIAGVLTAQKRYREALDMFEGVNIAKLNFETRGLYIDLLIATEQFERASREVKVFLQDKLTDLERKEMLVREAYIYTWWRKYSTAQTLWNELDQKYPNDQVILRMGALSLLWGKDPNRALQQFLNLVEKYPDDREMLAGFADAVAGADIGKVPASLREKVLRLYNMPDRDKDGAKWTSANYAAVGAALAKVGELDKSAQMFRKALEETPNARDVWRRYADVLYSVGRYEQADQIYGELLNNQTPRLRQPR